MIWLLERDARGLPAPWSAGSLDTTRLAATVRHAERAFRGLGIWGSWARLVSNRVWLEQYARAAVLSLRESGEDFPEEFLRYVVPSQKVSVEVFPPAPVWVRRSFGHISRDPVEQYRMALLSRPVIRYGRRSPPPWAKGKGFP